MFISIRSAASIDYADVSPGKVVGGDVDAVAPSAISPVPQGEAAILLLVSADIHVVMLRLWVSGLRCVTIHTLAPVIGATGPPAISAALVVQVAGITISVSDVFFSWRRRECGYCVHVLIAALTYLYAMAALLTPAGS